MIKKIYLFLNKNLHWVVRIFLLLLIPAAFIEHFAEWLVNATVVLYLLFLLGEHKKWWREVND